MTGSPSGHTRPGTLVSHLVNHLGEKRLRVRPHVEVLQLKLDSHAGHLNFFICMGPRDKAEPTRAGPGQVPLEVGAGVSGRPGGTRMRVRGAHRVGSALGESGLSPGQLGHKTATSAFSPWGTQAPDPAHRREGAAILDGKVLRQRPSGRKWSREPGWDSQHGPAWPPPAGSLESRGW